MRYKLPDFWPKRREQPHQQQQTQNRHEVLVGQLQVVAREHLLQDRPIAEYFWIETDRDTAPIKRPFVFSTPTFPQSPTTHQRRATSPSLRRAMKWTISSGKGKWASKSTHMPGSNLNVTSTCVVLLLVSVV